MQGEIRIMYRSILIRVWCEEEKEVADWQAEVQQIQSGENWTFSGLDALLEFLNQLMEDFTKEHRDK